MWWFGGFSQEQIDAWVQAYNIDPEEVKKKLKRKPLRCNSCKKFMSRMEAYVEMDNFRYHMNKKCLEDFGKQAKNVDFWSKPVKNIISGVQI